MENLRLIFLEVLSIQNIEFHKQLTAKDVTGWDSINHVRLILKVETFFKVKFTIKEIQSFENVGSLLDAIEKKVNS